LRLFDDCTSRSHTNTRNPVVDDDDDSSSSLPLQLLQLLLLLVTIAFSLLLIVCTPYQSKQGVSEVRSMVMLPLANLPVLVV
jgi:hypothetical protein